ncbi:hypothetical protein KC717_05500 [Candidatus Dojkabacteria bacterium]|uniref:Uncharacterized protein n=1 Tax=Candidatus Dojkabacteria bacterium TaxID=2099670 RepID=A0A955L9N1_9BACT|nr:hypothetical protein [Candidatus Dojkabacteria bacterium]
MVLEGLQLGGEYLHEFGFQGVAGLQVQRVQEFLAMQEAGGDITISLSKALLVVICTGAGLLVGSRIDENDPNQKRGLIGNQLTVKEGVCGLVGFAIGTGVSSLIP